jgi:hypothetical protein
MKFSMTDKKKVTEVGLLVLICVQAQAFMFCGNFEFTFNRFMHEGCEFEYLRQTFRWNR